MRLFERSEQIADVVIESHAWLGDLFGVVCGSEDEKEAAFDLIRLLLQVVELPVSNHLQNFGAFIPNCICHLNLIIWRQNHIQFLFQRKI